MKGHPRPVTGRLVASLLLLAGVLVPGPASAQPAPDEGAERRRELLKNERLLADRFGGWDLSDLHRRGALARTAEAKAEREALAKGKRILAAPVWSSLGPTVRGHRLPDVLSDDSGLVSHIALHPTDPKVIFVATAGGGVWRTTDGGATWKLVTDALGTGLQVGAVAVAPSSPKRVYAGTGCADASSFILGTPKGGFSVKVGIGVLISADGGETWRVSRTSPGGSFWDLLVAPDNPDVLIAATDQGIQRSTDGGDTWTAVLRTEEAPWATCLSRSTANPSVIFAATWGKGLAGSVWKSTDGGQTWVEKANGLPGDATTRTRIEVAVAPSDPNRVYAIVSGEKYQIDLARSSDGGATWTALGLEAKGVDVIGKQGDFATVMSVDPKNPDVVYAGGLDSWKSTDGGATWVQQSDWYGTSKPYLHADQHAHAHGPDRTVYFGNDGGLFASSDGGTSFRALNKGFVTFLVNHVCHDPNDVERMVIGAQDNSTSIRVTGTEWKETFTGDGYGCTFHRTNRDLILAAVQNESIYRSTDGGKSWARQIEGLTEARGASASFRTLLLPHPTEVGRVFTFTSRKVWVTDDFAGSWRQLSETMPIISNIADLHVSPSDPGRMALLDVNGQVVVSTNGGVLWEKVGEVPGSRFAVVRFDRTNPMRLWVATRDPRLSKERLLVSTDGGASWTAISRSGQDGGLPDLPLLSFEQDPRDQNVLWAGSFIGLYRSPNGGQAWERFGQGLPAAPVMGITPLADGSRLRVATFGRGAWEIATPAATASPTGGAGVQPLDAPRADFQFTPAAPRPGHAVHFEDDSTGTPTSFAWDFGDGKSSKEESPVHVFEAPGDYTVRLTATNSTGSSSTSKKLSVVYPGTGTGDVLTFLLPVVLTSTGVGGSSYTSELTLTNRTEKALSLTFRAKGTFEASSTYTLRPGQEVHPDVFAFLRSSTGMAVPETLPLLVSLRIEVRGASFPGQVGALVRVTTPPNEELARLGVKGRFGLSFPATALSTGASREAVVYGLQQTSEGSAPGTRSNLACVHAGPTATSPVKLEVTYRDGATGKDHPSRDSFELSSFEWKQIGAPLSSRGIRSGWATIRKVSGDAQFVCYGVLNDNVNSDGAFVPMVVADEVSPATATVVPVVVGTAVFRSELTVANRTNDALDVSLALVPNVGGTPAFGLLTLKAGEQKVFADVFKELPTWGIKVPEGTVAGSIYVELETGSGDNPDDPNDLPTGEEEFEPEPVSATKAFAGVRTYTTQAGGLFGLAYGPSPLGESADTEAWIYGLQQTGERDRSAGTRSNLALVHALDGHEEPLGLEVTYFGPDGKELGKEPDCAPCTLRPGEWRQFTEPLVRYGVPGGFARVRRVSGSDQFLAYGVLNDQLNGDGSYVPMNVP